MYLQKIELIVVYIIHLVLYQVMMLTAKRRLIYLFLISIIIILFVMFLFLIDKSIKVYYLDTKTQKVYFGNMSINYTSDNHK